MIKLAVIAEGPEENETAPFTKGSSVLVSNLLSSLGVPTNKVFFGHVSTRKSFRSPQKRSDLSVIEGMKKLTPALAEFGPQCVLVLGDLANSIFGGPEVGSYKGRGTLYKSPNYGYTCVCSLDTWQVQKEWRMLVAFRSDLSRAVRQSKSQTFSLPYRYIKVDLSFGTLVNELNKIIYEKPRIAIDLEGIPNSVGVTCYSIARAPHEVFIVPFRNLDNSPIWSLEEEMEIWRLTSIIFSDPTIRKIAHNAMYELFVFAYRHGILIRGLDGDTMFQMWSLFSELPKDLGFVSSLFTEEPYYKSERTVRDLHIHHIYCCKDSAVTIESDHTMLKDLSKEPKVLSHYHFNIRLLKPYTYMTLRGCKLDQMELARQKQSCWTFIDQQQKIVNEMSGRFLNTKSHVACKDYLYKDLKLPPQYELQQGEKILTSNFKALCNLYVDSELPVLLELAKLNRARTRFSDLNKLVAFQDGRIRCNYNTVGSETGRLSSSATFVQELIQLHKIKFVDRMVNKVKTKQMQLVSESKMQNLGTNLQNIPKDLRSAFIADEDCSFFQYDLSGADAWTVAADCASCGNDRMLQHLLNGIKPSIVIVLLTEFGNDVYRWDLPTLKTHHDALLKRCKSEPRLIKTYVCAKGCQHGTNYGMQPKLMAALQLVRSIEGWVDNSINGILETLQVNLIHANTMQRLQKLYLDYYGIELRNEKIRKQLTNFGYIDCASGQRRYFLDIRSRSRIDESIVRVAASSEPQANTTFVTNLAAANMYYDPTNRTPSGSLKCESLLMVHDALCGQTHHSHLSYSKEKMPEWFHNSLLINNIPITIPVEGGWGPNWKQTE